MYWETLSSGPQMEVYQLRDGQRTLLTLTIHPFSNSARIECGIEKRVFLIRKEGFRRNKTILRSEYGIKIGELGNDNKASFIDINNDRYYYNSPASPDGELLIYKDSADRPLVSCGFNTSGVSSFKLDGNKMPSANPGLLMALCWYMFMPIAREAEVNVA